MCDVFHFGTGFGERICLLVAGVPDVCLGPDKDNVFSSDLFKFIDGLQHEF